MADWDAWDPLRSEAQPVFATTHWSVVLATADQASSQFSGALEQLCGTYWYPQYAYVRRLGYLEVIVEIAGRIREWNPNPTEQ